MTLAEFLRAEFEDPDTGFSIGVPGAIAEFFRDAAEPSPRIDKRAYTVTTPRGAMRLLTEGGVQPVAIETPSRSQSCWQQRVALCLPGSAAAMAGRTTVTEIGEDHDSVGECGHRDRIFDLGLGIPHIDVCVRSGETELIDLLKKFERRHFFADGRELAEAIVERSPHRVFVSRLARIEVFSPIPTHETPSGPHTHLLPALFGKSDPAESRLPNGAAAAFDVYPANPLRDAAGQRRSFDAGRHQRFQRVLACWGLPDYLAEKQRLAEWVRMGGSPDRCPPASSETTRDARRVALRQMVHQGNSPESLRAWGNALENGAEP